MTLTTHPLIMTLTTTLIHAHTANGQLGGQAQVDQREASHHKGDTPFRTHPLEHTFLTYHTLSNTPFRMHPFSLPVHSLPFNDTFAHPSYKP